MTCRPTAAGKNTRGGERRGWIPLFLPSSLLAIEYLPCLEAEKFGDAFPPSSPPHLISPNWMPPPPPQPVGIQRTLSSDLVSDHTWAIRLRFVFLTANTREAFLSSEPLTMCGVHHACEGRGRPIFISSPAAPPPLLTVNLDLGKTTLAQNSRSGFLQISKNLLHTSFCCKGYDGNAECTGTVGPFLGRCAQKVWINYLSIIQIYVFAGQTGSRFFFFRW